MSVTTSSSYPVSDGSVETEPTAYGVGTASSKLVDRKADSPTGTWRPGDEPGHRWFLEIGDLPLESGEVLPNTVLAFETWGELSPQRGNAVLVLCVLIGDSHVTSEVGPGYPTPGWWPDLMGPGRAIDAEHYFMVAVNIPDGCQGPTGLSSTASDERPWGLRFPWLTMRDAVEAEARLADTLGIKVFHPAVGTSLGGHRAIEWGATHPQRVRNLALVATGASTIADQLVWCHLQELAIMVDPFFFDGDYYSHSVGPVWGLGLAQALAHATCCSAAELDECFGRHHQGEEGPAADGHYQAESCLDYHVGKLLACFDANTYLIVTHSMMMRDVGTGRGGVEAALARVQARTLVVDADSDRLFPPAQAEELAGGVPGARRETISPLHGHGGFLIEAERMDVILCDFLAGA